jgi:hypothetical protein
VTEFDFALVIIGCVEDGLEVDGAIRVGSVGFLQCLEYTLVIVGC